MATLRHPARAASERPPSRRARPAAPVRSRTGLPLAAAGAGSPGARSLRRMARAITANRKATVGARCCW